MSTALEITTLAGRNSIDFLEQAFAMYATGQVFAIARDGLDLNAYPGLRVTGTATVGDRLGWARLAHQPGLSDDPAQVVFTSGTEGLPKPIVLSHRNLADVVGRLNDAMALTDEVREYIGVPVTYSFGLGRARAVSAVGGAFYLPERFDPGEIRHMLEADEINAVSAVPSLWRVVLANPDAIGAAGAKVRWIEIGSQYMSQAEKEGMKRLFPNARIIQHYGLTEASRTTILDISANAGRALESVGAPTGSADVRLGADDAICIRGDHVALGLLGPDGTIAPLTDAEGWLVTRDRGALSDGFVWYQGRLDDQINVAGIKTSAEKLEQDIAALLTEPSSFAVVPVPDPLRGDSVLLAMTPDQADRQPLIEAAANIALQRQGISQRGVVQSFELAELPRTGTGKVQRRMIRDQYLAETDGDAPAAASPETADLSDLDPTQRRLAETWQQVLGPVPIRPGLSFYDVGGDSLTSVQMGLVMEKAGFDRATVSAVMQGRTIAEIATLESSTEHTPPATELPRQTVESWSISAVRGIMVISVLLSHWGPGLFERLSIGVGMEQAISFIYRMGTPGFAVIFGVGLGYFMLPGYPANCDSVRQRLHLALILVLSGLCLRAIAILGLFALQGDALTGKIIAVTFYNILAYYVLALASAILWLDMLSRCQNPILVAVTTALMLWLCWVLAGAWLPAYELDSLLEWPRLMLVANYSYFRLTAFALTGLALGYWLSQQRVLERPEALLLPIGILGATLIIGIALQAYGRDAFSIRLHPFFISLLGGCFYVCLATLFLGLGMRLVRSWHGISHLPRLAMQLLIVTGGLALPIYAFHSVVIPVKDILTLLGVPGAVALLLPMSIFLASMGYAGMRLYRIYFR
ncbi:MAG: AMP-binding protein [Pseudomonadota bacterium]